MVTFAFFIPEQQSGGVIFTDGPDVGHEMIDKILNVSIPTLSMPKPSGEDGSRRRRPRNGDKSDKPFKSIWKFKRAGQSVNPVYTENGHR